MSSTGVRLETNDQTRIIKGLIKNEETFIQSLRVFANTSTLSGLGATESESNNSPLDASGNFLTKAGDTMLGPIAFFPVDMIINTGIINISDATEDHSSRTIVSTEGASPTDELDRINGARFAGQLLFLQGIVGQAITLNNDPSGTGTGQFNIRTPDGNPFVLLGNQNVILIFDAIANQWAIVAGGSGSGGGGISFPIDFPEDDRGTVGPSTQIIDFSASTRHSVKMEITGDVDLAFSFPPTNETAYTNIIILQDGVGGHTVTLPVGTINKDIVEQGILTDPNAETGIVVKWAFGIYYAFLETGNIVSGGGGAGTLSNLTIDITKNWLGFAIDNLGGLTMTGDINLGTFDIQSIDRAIFAPSDGVVTDPAVTQILENTNSQFQFNTAETNEFIFSLENNSALSIEQEVGVNDTRFLAILGDSTNANSVPHLRLVKPQLVGVDNSLIGAIEFLAGDDIGSALSIYFSIDPFIEDNTSTSKDGTVIFNCMINNTLTDLMQFNRGSDGRVSIFGNGLDMQLRQIKNMADPTLAQDAATKAYVDANLGIQNEISQGDSSVIVTDAGSGLIQFTLDGNLVTQIQFNRMDFQDTEIFGVKALSFSNAFTARTVFTQNAADITMNILNSSDVFNVDFNTVVGFSIDEIKTQIHSTTPNTTAPELSLFRNDPSPADDDIVGFIDFTGRNSVAQNVSYAEIQVDIGNVLDGSEEGIMRFFTDVSGTSVNTLTLVDGRATITKFSTVDTDRAELRLTKEDASPGNGDDIADVNFQVVDSGVLTTYAEIRAQIKDSTDAGRLYLSVRADNQTTIADGLIMEGDDNITGRSYLTVDSYINSDLGFGFDGGGSLQAKIRPKSAGTQLGLVVQDNVDFTMGLRGTIALPRTNLALVAASAADTEGGDHLASILYKDDGITAPILYVRQADGNWSSFTGVRDALT